MFTHSGNWMYPIEPINKGVDDLECQHCGCYMVPVYELYRFDGNSDIRWSCSDSACLTVCDEEIRFAQSFKETWEHVDEFKRHEWVIKKKIDFKKVKK